MMLNFFSLYLSTHNKFLFSIIIIIILLLYACICVCVCFFFHILEFRDISIEFYITNTLEQKLFGLLQHISQFFFLFKNFHFIFLIAFKKKLKDNIVQLFSRLTGYFISLNMNKKLK